MIEYEVIKGVPSSNIIEEIGKLEEACFDHRQYDAERLQYEFEHKGKLLTLLAKDSEGYIGFKLGYERRRGQFYSWIGGVHPRARGYGVGEELLVRQHNLLRELEYKRVRTQTGNEFRSMLLLNIKNGFDVVGTFLNSKGKIRITLEKNLDLRDD